MLFESVHEVKHFLSLCCERDYLKILTLYLLICNAADEAVVALDSDQLIFRRKVRKQGQLSLKSST